MAGIFEKLLNAHREIDATVCEAYKFPENIAEEESVEVMAELTK